jgi:hypothetical protein
MPDPDKIVAVSFLTEGEWLSFRASLKHVFRLPADGALDDLLGEIDRVTKDADHDPGLTA